MSAKSEGSRTQPPRHSGKSWTRVGFILPILLVQGLAQWDHLALAQTPSVDTLSPKLGGYLDAMAVQADGRIVIGGGFTTVDSQTHVRLARLSPNGIVESGFTTAASASVYALAIQPDGKILVGGDFTSLGGQTRVAFGRLNANGTLDTSFTTHVFDVPPIYTITARVQAILVQPDGKMVLAGQSSLNGGPSGGYVLRLNTNGTSDTAFSTGGIGGGPVTTLALQGDGKILVGGLFSSVNNQTRYRLARLNANGSLDTAFNAQIGPNPAPIVSSLAVQADQKILVGGAFTMVAGQSRTNIARLNPNGDLDLDFNPGVTGSAATVYCLAVQADGKILVGGIFNLLAGLSRSRIGRLNSDGTPDSSFSAGANSDVYGLAIQADGKVLAGGFLTQLAGQPRDFIGRLNSLDPATQSLNYDGTDLTWMRSGSSCEVWRTTFDSSTDGTNWVNLGDGTRIAGGWQLASVALPPAARVRARGYATGGAGNASSWFVESVWPPAIPTLVSTNNLFGVRSNRFGFSIGGSSGSTVVVEGSTDLTGWTPIATNVLSSSALYFSDPDYASFACRFYRVRLQ
jgi:uncharacterized delta-60 repeat protein